MRVAADLVAAQAGHTILDIGTGNGQFPRSIVDARPGVSVVAYDPAPEMLAQAETMCRDRPEIKLVDEIPRQLFDWVTCFEVLEHLPEAVIHSVAMTMRERVRPFGRVIVSVPLEVGLSGAAKNLARAALGQSHPSSFREQIWAAVNAPVERRFHDGYCASHVGFDHRALPALFASAGLVITKTVYSPFHLIGGLLNSQVFWVLRAGDVPRKSAEGMDTGTTLQTQCDGATMVP